MSSTKHSCHRVNDPTNQTKCWPHPHDRVLQLHKPVVAKKMWGCIVTYRGSVSPTTEWITPATEWITPATEWITPATEWITPATEWITPATEHLTPATGWCLTRNRNTQNTEYSNRGNEIRWRRKPKVQTYHNGYWPEIAVLAKRLMPYRRLHSTHKTHRFCRTRQ